MKRALLTARKRSPLPVLVLLAGIGPILVAQYGPLVPVQQVPLFHHATRSAVPDIAFTDGQGRPLRLSEFKGRVVLLNVWATWCAPCREEMPSLNRLQAKLGGPEFEIVVVSIDRAAQVLSMASSAHIDCGVSSATSVTAIRPWVYWG